VRDDFRHFIFRDERKRAKYGRSVFRRDMRLRDRWYLLISATTQSNVTYVILMEGRERP